MISDLFTFHFILCILNLFYMLDFGGIFAIYILDIFYMFYLLIYLNNIKYNYF